jgi:uncharacterized RDD family membrane protein YckC
MERFRADRAGNAPRMIGVVLALIVIAIVLSLFGLFWVSIPIAVVGLILFVLFLVGFGRRAAAGEP